ncbi:MAG: biotin--[acetyl-CoA-carboxylase] ligase [Flavobacteriales bacterium]
MYHDTLFTGKQCFVLNSVDSTNNYAAELLKNGLAHDGAVVSANFQTHGRGQRDRIWQSKPGENLLLSYIFQPKRLNVSNQFLMNAAFALAICNLLRDEYKINAQIKWPNDIIVNDKKIAGLLVETSVKGSHIVSIIVGIGLNVNQTEFDDSLRATSINTEKSQTVDLNNCLNALSSQIEVLYLKLVQEKFNDILDLYNKVLYGHNTFKTFETPFGLQDFKVIGLRTDGKLKVLDKHQNPHHLEFGKCRMKWGV